MIKKSIKVLGLVACILATASSYNVHAQSSKNYNVTRISGESRYETSANIIKTFFPQQVNSVLISNGNSFPDALAGSVLSKKLNAPLLLVSNGDTSEDWPVQDYIYHHLPKDGTIYILGNESSISSAYLNNFSTKGYKNFKRLAGTNIFATNSAIVDEMNVQTGTPVVLVNGLNFPDALSISSIAASKGYPILMAEPNAIPNEILQKLISIKPSKLYMIGGTASLSDSIKTQAKNALPYINDGDIVRISGNDRYETSINVCSYFNLVSQNVVIANGENFPDALSGSALAGKLNAPIVLTDGKNIEKQKKYINLTSYNNIIILGGEASVNSTVENEFPGTKLKIGGKFPEYSDNKVIDFKNGDITGDGISENVILTCDSNHKSMLFIQDTKTGNVIQSKNLNILLLKVGEIILADVNGDKVDDIISIASCGGNSGNHECDIETFKANSLNQIGLYSGEENKFSENEDNITFSIGGMNTLNVHSSDFNKNCSIYLSDSEYTRLSKNPESTPYPDHGPFFSVSDIDKDGIYELRVCKGLSGNCNAVTIGALYYYYKYSNSSWKLVDFDANNTYPPCD